MMDKTSKTRPKVLIVVAHPDDETLWFLGGIKALSRNMSVDLLCLTYDENTSRGKELLGACADLPVQIEFGGVIDSGFNRCLKDVSKTIISFLEKKNKVYELIITHPPHGGEKPHPHHIQLFHAVRSICFERDINFGFFSEKQLPLSLHHSNKYYFSVAFEFRISIILLALLTFKKSAFSSSLKALSSIVRYHVLKKNKCLFVLNRFFIQSAEKQEALKKYESQIQHLRLYKSFSGEIDYLYQTDDRPESCVL